MSKKRAIVVDHDAGTNPDDLFAFLLLSKLKNVEIIATISGNRAPYERAALAERFCVACGIKTTHFVGSDTGCVDYYLPELLEDYTPHLETSGIYGLSEIMKGYSHVTYLAIQGLTNLHLLLAAYPKLSKSMDIVHMGLGTKDYESPVDGGTNMRADPIAAKRLYSSRPCTLRSVGLQTTLNDDLRITPATKIYNWIQECETEVQYLLSAHLLEFYTRRKIWPAMHDTLTAAVAAGETWVNFREDEVFFTDDGRYIKSDKKGSGVRVTVSSPDFKAKEFFEWFSDTCMKPQTP